MGAPPQLMTSAAEKSWRVVMSVLAKARAMEGTPWKDVGRVLVTKRPNSSMLKEGIAWCIWPVQGPKKSGAVVMAMCTKGVKATTRAWGWNWAGSWAWSWWQFATKL